MDWVSLSTVGPWGLVTICVMLIFTGRLVPGRERDYWRKAFFSEQEMRKELAATGQVARKVLTALTPPMDGE
jgi:hypothetical protein